jgi:hypothetical protein
MSPPPRRADRVISAAAREFGGFNINTKVNAMLPGYFLRTWERTFGFDARTDTEGQCAPTCPRSHSVQRQDYEREWGMQGK